MRSGLAAAADAMAGLHAGLAAAQELADGNGFTIAADGIVAEPSPMHLPLPLPLPLPVRRRVTVPGPACGPRSWTGSSRCCARPVRSTRSSPRCCAHRGGHGRTRPVAAGALRPPSAFSAPPGGSVADSVADSAGWWSVLSAAARHRVVAEHPEWIGNRDGIPAAARDAANRRLLVERAALLDADLRALQARYDALTASGPGPLEAAWLAARDDLLARLAELRRRQEVVDAVAAAAAGTDRTLLLLDLERARPRAAVAAGDVDTADHVAVLTPGFGNTVGGDLARCRRHGRRPARPVRRRARPRRSRRRVGGGRGVARLRRTGRAAERRHRRRRPARRRRPGPLLRRDRRGAPHRPAPHRARPLLRLADHRLRAAAGARCR